MYQQPAQQTGVQTFLSQQPAVDSPQGHGPPPQPVMYQMSPGQPQPVFTGQPAMGQQGQPLQYYVAAGQPGQPVHIQGAPAQPPESQEEDVTTIKIDMKYLKSALFFSRIIEFVFLSIAWPCAIVYSGGALSLDGRVNFFKGITIFSWVMVILSQIVFMFSINKNKNYFRQPSYFTLVSLGIQVVLTILLITCTVSFTTRVVDLHKFYRDSIGGFTLPGSTVALIYAATIFGIMSCVAFLDDIRLLSEMYAAQRSKEIAVAAGVAQQPAGTHPQQQVGARAQFPSQPAHTQ